MPPAQKTARKSVAVARSVRKRPAARKMSRDHKAALSEGREQGLSVRVYLEALDKAKPKRGRRRTPDSIKKRLVAVESELSAADALKRLQLVQERIDLKAELTRSNDTVDVAALEKTFVEVVRPYSQRKGISYAAWRAVGVPAAVLQRAGISRST